MSRLIEGYIREAFEERNISEAQSKELWQYYYKHLNKALAEGYSPTIEETNTELVTSLKHNLARFSAFKETSFKQQIEASLTKNGKVLSWQEFKAEANKLNIEYNRRWLQTEYNQTVANALSAQKYEEYITNKRIYPNLTYHAVHDERTRETHRAWDGLTLPVEHSFWKTHLPPNDWGCRCYVEPTADPVTEGARTEDIPIKEAFANNPALSGEIFPIIPYAKGMSEKAVKEVEKQVEKRLKKENKKEGKVTIDKNYDKNDFERNKYIAEICAKQTGFDFHIREHIEVDGLTNPEYLINGTSLGDRKSITSNSGIKNQIDAAKKQMLNLLVNPNKESYYIVWDLDEVKELDWGEITHNLSKKITKERGKYIEGMFFQYKGKAVYLSREDIINRDYKALDDIK